MTPKTSAQLKTQFEGTDPTNHNDDILDYIDGVARSYGQIHVTGGSTAQSLTATTPVKLTLFAVDGASSADQTPDHTDDSITLANAGVYWVFAQFSMTSDTNLPVLDFNIAVAGVITGPGCQRKIGTGADVGSASFGALVTIAAGQKVSISVESSLSIDLTLTEAELVIVRVA